MSFLFERACRLLQELEEIATLEPPLLKKAKDELDKKIISNWFKSNRTKIKELDANGTAALLSTLLPQWRTDRVYGMQAQGLFRILCRHLNVSSTNRHILEAYKQPGKGDLGACLERMMKAGGTRAEPAVKLQEVDDAMQSLAAGCSFSDSSITRAPSGSSGVRAMILGDLLKRLHPHQGKWFARLVLKDFGPVQIDKDLVLRGFHFLLPDLLQFHRDFAVAASLLKNELLEYPEQPMNHQSRQLFRQQAAKKLQPRVGTKVGRPYFHKARSIDHCLRMMGSKRWAIERKYDGEYCEIHVDLEWSPNPKDCIRIFSKSGKVSTADRSGLMSTLVQTLRLGRKECRIQKRAILLGEMVVYSDQDECILPFEKIRKHVSRSGRRIGVDADSQPHAHEHLAIVFFDLLLLDDEIVMCKPVNERRTWLRETYKKIHGRAMSAEWKLIDFSSREGKRLLGEEFMASIDLCYEGLVLKPCDTPYFSLEGSPRDYQRSYIKLKKDYINDMGNEADFAVMGASYQAQQAATSGLSAIKWTSFHLGCLINKDDARKSDVRPVFKYVATIHQDKCIPTAILEAANSLTAFGSRPYVVGATTLEFDIESHQNLKMDVAINDPFVFEVLGSAFEKPSNCNFLMLRHPRVKKLHEDRTWKDCITFQELQAQGAASRAAPVMSASHEERRWLQLLGQKLKRKRESEASTTPISRRISTPSISLVSISQRTSPRKPGARRVQDLETISETHVETSELLSSPMKRSIVTAHAASLVVDSEDEASIAQYTRAKRPRVQSNTPSLLLAPPKHTSPLSEISINAEAHLRRHVPNKRRPSTSAIVDVETKVRNWMQLSACTHAGIQSCARPAVGICEGSQCAFDNSAIYLVPCKANYAYVVEDLIGSHNTTITPELSHWDRDSFAHPQLTETVSESQSHPGMRKIIFVEKHRQAAVQGVVQEVLSLNAGQFRERIEIYDWRVLEKCKKHDQAPSLLKEYGFLGATLFDDTRKRAVFVSNCGWL